MSNVISQKTLIPISSIIVMAVAVFYFSISYAKIEKNEADIVEQKAQFMEFEKETNAYYIDIIQRLARIEGHLKKDRK